MIVDVVVALLFREIGSHSVIEIFDFMIDLASEDCLECVPPSMLVTVAVSGFSSDVSRKMEDTDPRELRCVLRGRAPFSFRLMVRRKDSRLEKVIWLGGD
jgi:hypothetical protein